MISVLIPVYNYNVQSLVENLLHQFESINCKWELFLSDDVSNPQYKNQNSNYIDELNLTNVKLFQQETNIGNAANRNFLIDKATNDWLLFLDADVLAVREDFLSNYIGEMKSTSKDLISGNIIYDHKNPQPNLLRWKYGKQKEEIGFEKRNAYPILNLRGANFAIRRGLAKDNNFPLLKETYGFVDTRFFLQFNQSQVLVIENPVYHLGIEDNDVFVSKTKKAIANAMFLMNTNDELASRLTLVSSYKKIRVFRFILNKIHHSFYSRLERNLLSKNPSLFIFQLFKILYLSSLDVSENT